MNTPILSVRQLRKYFQGRKGLFQRGERASVKAVDAIGFEMFPSETFAIIGESGSGKTTTLKMILLLERPDAGEIIFKEENVLALDGKRRQAYRKAVQAVFQDPYSSLSPRMRVGDIVAEPLQANSSISKSAVSDEVARLLSLVGLRTEVAARYPHEFSGGQRQRIAIARALSSRPDLIVLDEPVSALDISIRAQIVNLLQDIQQSQGVSFLLVSHDLPIVRHMSHRTAVMYLGKLVEMGPTEALYERPRHPYTRALLSSALPTHPRDRRSKRLIASDAANPIQLPSGCRYRLSCPLAFEKCTSADPEIEDLGGHHSVACHLNP